MTTRSAANDSVREQFGAVAAAYVSSAYHSAGPDLKELVAAANFNGDERVLDMGSGAGHMALAVAPHVGEVTGIDVTPEMVPVAGALANERGLPNVRFQVGDVTALPFAEGAFDVVTSRVSAHHYADPQRALEEARRVLVPDGRFFLIDTVAPEDPALDTFFNAFELLRDASHVRNWRGSEWARMFAQAGFEARMLQRFAVGLDGENWVKRMRTPPSKVAMLRELFSNANAAQRAAFDLEDGPPWRLSVPIALFEARRS
jgi:ubiquinone/menaquinone biosynthesis C-methylase UbiE